MERKQNQEILCWIRQQQDEKYREFHSGLTPGCGNLYGVRLPVLRTKAKELAGDGWKEYLKSARDDSYEEIMLQGLTIGYLKVPLAERLPYLASFIPKIHNWAVCDSTCNTLKITEKEPELMWDFLQPYMNSEEEFSLRFCLVMYLSYYLKGPYINQILYQMEELDHPGYYVKMAVAWCLAEAYLYQPVLVTELLKRGKLDVFTHNKSIQKMRESYRISTEEKEQLTKLKRKETI